MNNDKKQFELYMNDFFERKFGKLQTQKLTGSSHVKTQKSSVGTKSKTSQHTKPNGQDSSKAIKFRTQNIEHSHLTDDYDYKAEFSILQMILAYKAPVILKADIVSESLSENYSKYNYICANGLDAFKDKYGIKYDHYNHFGGGYNVITGKTNDFKKSITIPITQETKDSIFAKFLTTDLGRIYSEIEKSKLGDKIKMTIKLDALSSVQTTYDKNNTTLSLRYFVESYCFGKTYPGNHFKIDYTELGYGCMSEQAIQAISLLITKTAADVFNSLPICEGFDTRIIKDYDYPQPYVIKFNLNIKQKRVLPSW